MADAIDQAIEPEQTEPTEPQGEAVEAKPETDWKAEARKWEKRAKENKAAADELSALKASSDEERTRISELEERAAKAEKEAADLMAEKERREWLNEAAREFNVPAEILRGESLEEIKAHAAAIKAAMPSLPVTKGNEGKAAAPVTREGILAIENEKERLAAIKANIDLF